MVLSFSELWEKCEEYQKEASLDVEVPSIIKEIIMKFGLYNAIEVQIENSFEDKEKAKSRLMGEILLSLTALSLKDNINVYEALQIALTINSIENYSEKYK